MGEKGGDKKGKIAIYFVTKQEKEKEKKEDNYTYSKRAVQQRSECTVSHCPYCFHVFRKILVKC